eukprot:TRINITY_DN49761_c0_g1_i3.p1 TRINITY_DN49761_c0_g1~~TRINITY_DN49761_c0_g1_i3.p1  ORF type:complete len:175 (+),score=58.29 TRINITY_DN49761_c0_g1_i3:119-643(+)
MIRRPPRSTLSSSSAASDVYKRQEERSMSDGLLARLTYLTPNESELARLTGLECESEEQIVAACKQLQTKGVANVSVTLGSKGSLLVTKDGRLFKQLPCKIPGGRVVDTTGAGDTYRAAFSVALVEGQSLEYCLKFAGAAGAIACATKGAVPSLPYRSQVAELAERVVVVESLA